MEGELNEALERLSVEEAFLLVYGAYIYLARPEGNFLSSTRELLRRLGAGDVEAVLLCLKKALEEEDEVRRVLAGQHSHEGQAPRDTLVNELQQLLYWPCLIAVGQGVAADAVRFVEFLMAGLSGREPEKSEYEQGMASAGVILRRLAAAAGRAVAAFNQGHPEVRPIELREIVLADLRQMASREYLAAYLRAQPSVNRPA
jgi:hypothetical protein